MVKTLKNLAIFIGIAAFIYGIVAGNIYAPEPKFVFEDKKFLWSLAFMIWVAGGITTIFTYAFGMLLEFIENISNKMDSVLIAARSIDDKMPKK